MLWTANAATQPTTGGAGAKSTTKTRPPDSWFPGALTQFHISRMIGRNGSHPMADSYSDHTPVAAFVTSNMCVWAHGTLLYFGMHMRPQQIENDDLPAPTADQKPGLATGHKVQVTRAGPGMSSSYAWHFGTKFRVSVTPCDGTEFAKSLS